MHLRIDEILLCANFYYPSLKIVACIDGTKKALNEEKDTNKQTKGQHVFWNVKINYKKTIRPIEMKLAGIVVLIGPLRFQFKRWGSLKRGRQGRPRKVKFSQICPLKIQYRSKTYAIKSTLKYIRNAFDVP